MAAVTSETRNYNAIQSTTLENWAKGIGNTITTSLFFYNALKKSGSWVSIADPGERARYALRYQNGTADSYSGYDVMNTTPMDGITTAFFDWAQMAVSISISRKEERQNSGGAKMLDLLEEKSNQAMDGIIELFSKALLQGNGPNTATAITTQYTSPLNGSLFFTPLPLMVGHSASSGTIGSVSAANAFWQNQQASTSITSFAVLLKALDHLRNLCTKGVGGAPDMHLVDQATQEVYVAALRNQNRYTDTTRADIPFDNIAFHSQPVVWEEFMPNWATGSTTQVTTQGTWLMLNSKFLQLKYDAETNFITTPFIRPENQDAKTAQILFMGTLGTNNRRKHGVEDTIDTTITS